jgi:tetratricopeptide (TPR) repeat protein
MPKRKRTQRIEEESRRAFAGALDERFLFRDDVPDFGIDGSVEEFDHNDNATGLRYFTQLKATDAEETENALKRSIPIEHANLYNSLPLPLLMVRYLASSDELYVRWWHNPLPGKRPPKANAASLTFHWSAADRFEAGDSDRLAEEARGFLELRSASPPLPFFFEVATEDTPFGLTDAEIELALKAQAKKRPDVVELRWEKATGRIFVDGKLAVIELSGTRAASYELGESYDPGVEGEQLAIDLMALTATALARWGQSELAARMASTFFASSTLAAQPEAALLLSGSMTDARRLSEALAIAEEIDASGLPAEKNTSFFFTLTPRRHGGSLSDAEKAEYVTAISRRIERREGVGEEIEASREAVSLANFLRVEHDGPAAVELYERAAQLDPEYLQRVHYWHELAGVFFFSGRYDESAKAYAKTLELGGDEWAALLRADALMFAGAYAEAREAFRAAVGQIESFERGSEYPLKIGLLDTLIDECGLARQERNLPAAKALLEEVIKDDWVAERDQLVAKCWEAIDVDGLDPIAWWNLASATEKEGDLEVAGLRFLYAALCQPVDAEAWAFSFLHLWSAERHELLPMILTTGERLTGGRVLPEINRLMKEAVDPKERGELISALGMMVEELADPRSDGFELRFVRSGEEVESVEIRGARTREN